MTDPGAIVTALGVYAGALVVGAISSVVPIVSIEVFLVGLTLATGTGRAVPIVILAAAGQVAGKLPIYYATRGVTHLAGRRHDRVERFRAWIARWQHAPRRLLAISAVSGLPPFSLMATAAGALAIRVRTFCVVVFAGRALRFAIVIAVTAAWQDAAGFRATLAQAASAGEGPARVDGRHVPARIFFPPCAPGRRGEIACRPTTIPAHQEFRARLAPVLTSPPVVLTNQSCQDIASAIRSAQAAGENVVSLQKFHGPGTQSWRYQAVIAASPAQ